MTSRFSNRATGVAAATAIVLLVLLIVLLWTGVGQDIIQSGYKVGISSPRRTPGNATEFRVSDDDLFETVTDGPDFIDRDRQATNERASSNSKEYVRPMKISSLGLNEADFIYGRDLNRDQEPILLRHHSGHFRHRTANIWDPHPMYEFTAFKKNFLLVLEHDTGFASPDLRITHIWHNSSTRRLPNFKSNGCFYKGYVKGDPSSSVAVSLCHGMTGNIRTSTGNYFIEPFEVTSDHAKPMEHVIYEMAKTGRDGQSHCGLDDYESLKFHVRKATSNARTKQESEMLFDYETDDRHRTHHFDSEERTDYDARARSAKRKRSKRSSSEQYFVEILVVADGSMANYHGNNTANYILTLMYIVSGIFKDASIGNPITIAVVNLHIDYDVSYVKRRYDDHNGVSAAEMLREFCHRASKNSHMEYHHDTALLLTRENICRNASAQKCETLGLAELGTMCDKRSSCSLVQDNGLSAAFTIAHELGHVFNMPHDDAEIKCQNHTSADSVSHVMSTSLKEGTNPWSWSECSRHFITEFLESRHSFCLRDPPIQDIIKKVPQDVFPGETILGNRQCELLYGEGSRVCSFMPVCSALWCNKLDSDSCQTLHMPWGDGTPCAQGAWCQKGACVEKNRKALKKVDGGWGPWQDFGPCSRTCGGGIRKAVRYCDSPVPQNGGSYCIGKRVKYESCETKDCRDGSRDFREEQCSAFDHNNHNIHGIPVNVKWVPKYGLLNDDRCVLYCRPEKGSLYYPLKDKVIDGTPCSPDSFDICVNGQCKPAGCDHILGSKAKLDICGKCNGKNNTCRLIKGTFNELATGPGYRHVTIIPAGSSNLDIIQYGVNGDRDSNFLALSDGTAEGRILNNAHVLATSKRTIEYAGIILDYSGCMSGPERINATRALRKDLYLQVLSVSAANHTVYTFPNISYQYTVPLNFGYVWKHIHKWEPCDKVCKGLRIRKMVCVALHTREIADDEHCRNSERPTPIYDECNMECTLKWRVIASPCSSSCGRGLRNLTKQCVQEFDNDTRGTYTVHNSSCAHLPNPPPDVEECEGPCSSFNWEYGDWSMCSKTCGWGTRKRAAICVDKIHLHHVEDKMCDPQAKVDEEDCWTTSCPDWAVGNWSQCSVTCGNGTQTRELWCQRDNQVINMSYCNANTRPITEETCMLKRCYYWSFSEWSKCSATCGRGKRRRTTVCKSRENIIVDNSACKEYERPSDTSEECSMMPCPLRNIEDNSIPGKSSHRRKGVFYYKHPRWESYPGTCSVTCGKGIRKMQVRCVVRHHKERRPVDRSKCDPTKEPKSTEICELKPCVVWVKSPWSTCSKSCGKGVQHRQVSCRNINDDTFLKDEDCAHLGQKPEVERGCGKPCRRSNWKYSQWSPCSASCGYGEKTRTVKCVNVTIESNEVDGYRRLTSVVEVDKKFCVSKNKRKDKKKCRKKLCPLTWIEGEWSACSKTCGKGVQTRNVTCHKVNMYDWLDPVPLKNESVCNISNRPTTVRNCIIGDCNSPFHWSPEEWQECTTPCGRKGTQRRVYKCRDRKGAIQDKSNCYGLNKPLPKSRPCNRRPCHPISCKEIQLHTNNRSDGEYMMLVGGKNMSIYCKGMNTASPEEYLTIDYPNNYSEFIGEHGPINPNICHEYGGRNTRASNCDCAKEYRYGRTTFHKVRLLVDTLQIVTDDFTFTETRGRRIPLGEAGGCCCRSSCPRGSFKISLNGTSLQVTAPIERWVMKTPETTLSYSSEDFQISGECGGKKEYGSCGLCGPVPLGRLKLHIVPP